MSDYRNDQQNPQTDPDQKTRVMPPVEGGAYSAAPRRRRADRYRTEPTQEETAEASTEYTPRRINRTEEAAPSNRTSVYGDRVQTRYAARPPVREESVPSQGVPRPAALSRSSQEQREQANAGADQGANIRRPVNAPGYARRAPLGTEPRQPMGQEVRQPVQGFEPLRARRPVVPELEETESVREDKPAKQRKGHGLLVTLLIIVLVLGLVILAFLLIPNDDSTLGQIKTNVSDQLSGLLGGSILGQESTPAPEAMDFSAAPTQGTAPLDVAFTLTTSKSVDGVRVVDEDGNPLSASTSVTMDNADSRIWMLNLAVESGYSGTVQAQILSGEEWLDTDMTQLLEIAPPPQATIDTSAFALADETAVPTETVAPTATAVVTATPTLAPTATAVVTATPTLAPTLSPTDEPTQAPTDTPAPTQTIAVTNTPTIAPTTEPTLEPTATLEPTIAPTATPVLSASAADSADPSLIANQKVYNGSTVVENYNRAIEDMIKMPAADAYTTLPYGVMTYRGNAFRQNAAVGNVDAITSMSLAWTADAGSVKGSSSTYYGIGWTGQPVIIKWSKEVREASNIVEEKRSTVALKEVIVAGLDGKIYFLDLADGQPTRDAINVGYPMKGTPSLHPLGYPVMTVGQYARKMASGTGDIGLRFYDLLTQKQVYMIDGLDGKLNRPYYEVGAFDTSALIDPVSDTLITAGTNGLLYLTKLNTEFDYNQGTISIEPESVVLKSSTAKQTAKYTAVESSLAMYANYVFYADSEGILRCVDTNTLETVWAVDTEDAVQAAISLDLDANGDLWLYTANTLSVRTKGDCQIRRFNAMTGEEDWVLAVNVVKKASNGKVSGAMASAVIGENDLSDLAYFTLSNLSESGTKEIFPDSSKAASGVILAVNKKTGAIVWAQELDSYGYSSPVAVYTEEGKGWIIQASASGMLYLMDGLTGTVIDTLELDGTIEGSPAVYGSTLVIGTTGKNTSHIYGITLE